MLPMPREAITRRHFHSFATTFVALHLGTSDASLPATIAASSRIARLEGRHHGNGLLVAISLALACDRIEEIGGKRLCHKFYASKFSNGDWTVGPPRAQPRVD